VFSTILRELFILYINDHFLIYSLLTTDRFSEADSIFTGNKFSRTSCFWQIISCEAWKEL